MCYYRRRVSLKFVVLVINGCCHGQTKPIKFISSLLCIAVISLSQESTKHDSFTSGDDKRINGPLLRFQAPSKHETRVVT